MKERNYFIGTKKSPFHLSVGAVVINKKAEILCHHFPKGKNNPDFYLLMRNTLSPGESLEKALAVGLREEFGIKAKIISYLGALESSFVNWEKAKVNKITLYFLCSPVTQNKKWITSAETKGGHFEKGSNLEWKSPRFLISRMKKQGREMGRSDFDESEIIARAMKFLTEWPITNN